MTYDDSSKVDKPMETFPSQNPLKIEEDGTRIPR